MRFLVHTLTEEEFNEILSLIYGNMNADSIIMLETRSTKDIVPDDLEKAETNFKSSIGTNHYRMLYSLSYLTKKLQNQFQILEATEEKDVAIYKSDNPYVLRIIAKKKPNV